MIWGKGNKDEHVRLSKALTANYDERGRSGSELLRSIDKGLGSRGGAPIWVMREAWMSKSPATERRNRRCTCPDPMCIKHGFDKHRTGAITRKRLQEQGKWLPQSTGQYAAMLDPDGFAVFGRYPKGFLCHVLKMQLVGDVRRDEILHVCSGTLGPTERWTVDLRKAARPMVMASGTALPFKDNSFKAVMMDPPYSDQYAKNLYGVENPRPSWLLREAARVLCGGGRIGILHVAVPFAPPGCRLVNVYGISTGVGFRIRAFTVYEKEQERLAL